MKLLLYTFRTNPFSPQLREEFPDIVVLGSLKADMRALQEKIALDKPEHIIGIAALKSVSQIELRAVNKFNAGTIRKGGILEYSLAMPSLSFPIAVKPTTSFCNWSMYVLAEFVSKHIPTTKLSFIHLNVQDLQICMQALRSLLEVGKK